MRRRVLTQAIGIGLFGAVASAFAIARPRLNQPQITPPPTPEVGQPTPVSTMTPPRAASVPPTATAIATPSPAAPATLATPTPAATPVPSSTPAATPVPSTTVGQVAGSDRPIFSDVTNRTPAEGIKFLQGQLTDYPGAGPQSLLGFSASDILETLDTVVVDQVGKNHGAAGLNQVYDTIASEVLGTLLDLYGDAWVLVPLDAGHGGDKAEFWDPGSNGTEALHTRAVAASVQRLAKTAPYARFTVVPIFNDEIPDYFDVPGKENEPLVNQTVMRQIRAAMLAYEAARWNREHPDPASAVVVHEISIHFNSGVGGAMVLHQSNVVPAQFEERSINYGARYLQRAIPALNATAVLPTPLKIFGATGLHDDVMMYTPGGQITDDAGNPIVLRYGLLQGGGFEAVYVGKILKYA